MNEQTILRLIFVPLKDVLDLSWSAKDNFLASCSVDNTVIIWNALSFPGNFFYFVIVFVNKRCLILKIFVDTRIRSQKAPSRVGLQ